MAKVQIWKRRGAVSDDAVERSEVLDPSLDGSGDAFSSPPAHPLDAGDGTVATLAEPEPEPEPEADEQARVAARLRLSIADSTPVTLFLSAHPRQAVATSLAMTVAALVAGRPAREAAVVGATVLVGQAILGWHNDIVDRARDARHHTPRKPVAEGRLDVGSAWFALIIALLLAIPLSISTGVTAGLAYLISIGVALVGNVALRRGRFSWLPWAISFALYPAYLSYGGWGGGAQGQPPEIAITVLAGLLGIGVHFLRSIWGLVADDEDGWTYLPLTLGRRLGATRLLVLSLSYTVVVSAVLLIVASTVGLRQ